MNQKYLTTQQYSKLTGISQNTIRRNFRKGTLTNAVKVGGRILIIVSAEEQQIKSNDIDFKPIADVVEQIGNKCIELSNLLKSM